jgi:hypothetical protein
MRHKWRGGSVCLKCGKSRRIEVMGKYGPKTILQNKPCLPSKSKYTFSKSIHCPSENYYDKIRVKNRSR